jgi:hypothetical protein
MDDKWKWFATKALTRNGYCSPESKIFATGALT